MLDGGGDFCSPVNANRPKLVGSAKIRLIISNKYDTIVKGGFLKYLGKPHYAGSPWNACEFREGSAHRRQAEYGTRFGIGGVSGRRDGTSR